MLVSLVDVAGLPSCPVSGDLCRGRGGLLPFRTVSKVIQLSLHEFAAMEIRGLSSHVSVRKYRRAWQLAIDEGWAKAAVPGRRREHRQKLSKVTVYRFLNSPHVEH